METRSRRGAVASARTFVTDNSSTGSSAVCVRGAGLYGRTLCRRWMWMLALYLFLGLTLGDAGVAAVLCSKEEFACQEGGCIPRWLLCDGHVQCPSPKDNSDENNCPNKNKCAADGGVQCLYLNQSRCWPERYRCDNHTDCDDGEDERGCDTRAEARISLCRWSQWSDCSPPTCNVQTRYPAVVPGLNESAAFKVDFVNCSTPNQTRSCSQSQCSGNTGMDSKQIVIVAVCVIVTLIVFGCLLEIFLRRQLKRTARLVKSDSEHSSHTTGSAAPLRAHDTLAMYSMPPASSEATTPAAAAVATAVVVAALPRHPQQHPGKSSSVAGGSYMTAETFLDNLPTDTAQITALHTAEIRRSLRLAVADIERRTDSDRSMTASPSQSNASVAHREKLSDRRALVSPGRQHASHSASGINQASSVIASSSPSIYCPMCSGYNPGQCNHIAAGKAVASLQSAVLEKQSMVSCDFSKLPVVQIADEGHFRNIVVDGSQFHRVPCDTNHNATATQHHRPAAAAAADCEGFAATAVRTATPTSTAPSLSSAWWHPSQSHSINPDLIMLANALQVNAGTGSMTSAYTRDESSISWKPAGSSSLDGHSTCSSSRHSRSQMTMPCNTPVSNMDVRSSSFDETASCNRLFHSPPQLAVSGAA